MGTPLVPKYIPYTYMDPLGKLPRLMRLVRYSIPASWRVVTTGVIGYPFLSIPKGLCRYMGYTWALK